MPHSTTRSLLLAASLAVLGTITAQAQTVTKQSVSLELAKKIAAKAEAEAVKNKWTMVIAIVDDGGNLVYLEKMDGTQIGSIEVAQYKATTALKFKRPTKAFEDVVLGGRTPVLSLPNAIAIEGGLPIIVDGSYIGAIGVSGMKSTEDGVAAAAGLTALPQP